MRRYLVLTVMLALAFLSIFRLLENVSLTNATSNRDSKNAKYDGLNDTLPAYVDLQGVFLAIRFRRIFLACFVSNTDLY